MNKKNHKKRYEFQERLIKRQSEQIKKLNSQIEELKLKCEAKDENIKSVSYLKEELVKTVEEAKKYKEQYKSLIEELKKMKDIVNREVYRGRWRLIKFFLK